MGKRITVVGGDRRQTYLARRLEALGEVRTLMVPDCPDCVGEEICDYLILPCPSFNSDGALRAGEGLPLERLLSVTGPETLCFGGALSGRRELLPLPLRNAVDLLADPEVAAENGRLTAEATLALTLLHTEDSLRGKRCLILGWGRIGKPLSRLLRAADASVTVCVRREEVLAEAAALGYRTTRLQELSGSYDLVFNTVPARVLKPAQLADLGADCLWVELASSPGGLEPSFTGLSVLRAGGLPGKLAPKAAAEALYQRIVREIEV